MQNLLEIVEPASTGSGAWDSFVDSQPDGTIYHTHAWRSIMEAEFGCETHYLCARDGSGAIQGVLPLARLSSLLFGDFLISLPYVNYGGILAASLEADAQLTARAKELAKELGVSHVELREQRPRSGEWPVRTDKVAMKLELCADAEAQWDRLGTKVRAQIKRPGREGARVTVGGAELLRDYYHVFSRNMRDLGTPVYAPSFFARILSELRENADIVIVYLKGDPAAAGLLIHHRATTEIPWASSLRNFNKFGVNMLLYWECLKRAIERRAQSFDFGRSTVDSGPYRFKLQWGATPAQLYWHYWLRNGGALPNLSPANPRYAIAINVWRRMPLSFTNTVGPYVVRHLP